MMKNYNVNVDLEVRHLRLVREVSATGSLTRAGAALHLTQSALSHQLRDIESRLGTALFLRVGKRMVLTPAGERVLRAADEVLATIERTEDAVRQLAGAKRGVLRLTTECYTCYQGVHRSGGVPSTGDRASPGQPLGGRPGRDLLRGAEERWAAIKKK